MNQAVRPLDMAFHTGCLRYDASRISSAGLSLFDPSTPQLKAVAVGQGGRQAAWFVEGEFGEGVLRYYRRGGLMARINADRYLWTGPSATRSFAEFDLLRSMLDQGLPVPRPIAAVYWRHGFVYRAAILVQRIPGVQPLARVLEQASPQAVAGAIYAMHEADVWHSDLNAYNILLDEAGHVWLIDFDKCHRQELSVERRQANLLRLRRSLDKVADAAGLLWWDELSRAYGLLMRAKGIL